MNNPYHNSIELAPGLSERARAAGSSGVIGKYYCENS
jgi:hypothetical protein